MKSNEVKKNGFMGLDSGKDLLKNVVFDLDVVDELFLSIIR